jgi:drug/metabolite transporter (DMT)-like permease
MSTVLQGAQVVLVPLAAWWLLREAPSRAQLVALPVALAGCVLISGVVGSSAYGAHPMRGAAYGLLAAVGFAAFQLGIVAAARGGSATLDTFAAATAWAAALCIAWGLATGDLEVPGWPAQGWLVLLAVLVQVVGWTMIVESVRHLPAATVSFALMLQLAGSVLLGALLFDEAPVVVQWLGIALVLGSVLVAARRPRPDDEVAESLT